MAVNILQSRCGSLVVGDVIVAWRELWKLKMTWGSLELMWGCASRTCAILLSHVNFTIMTANDVQSA
jgi:hypothetical protein